MSESFHFHPHPSLEALYDRLFDTPKGKDALGRMISEFGSVTELLQGTIQHSNAAGGPTTEVFLPDATTLSFINVPRREFAHAAYEIAETNGYNIG